MRKILFLFVFVVAFSACDDVVKPSSIIQGEVNETLFRSNNETAFVNESGELIIQGTNVDAVTLRANANAVGLYEISPGSGNSASFVRDGNTFITAGPNTGGMIEIEEITPAYVTGNFYFEARRNGVGERLNFSKGEFWRVPFGGADLPGEDNPIGVDDEFTATINGNNFDYISLQISPISSDVDIIASSATETINLVIPNPTEVGQYTFEDNPAFEAYYISQGGSQQAVEGNIDITAFNAEANLVSGTFSFTTAEGTTVTNGEFVINF
mgnify:CR=1 FL=1